MANTIINFLKMRRSVKPDLLTNPSPSYEELETILTIAARVPDHKKMVPWRFLIIQGEARVRLGAHLAQICMKEEKVEPSPVRLELERGRFLRAPLVVCVISRVIEKGGAPEWGQVLSCGAACMNLCLAANALNYRTCWITEWMAYSSGFAKVLKLATNEKIAGFIYIGTPKEQPVERERPQLSQIVSYWEQET